MASVHSYRRPTNNTEQQQQYHFNNKHAIDPKIRQLTNGSKEIIIISKNDSDSNKNTEENKNDLETEKSLIIDNNEREAGDLRIIANNHHNYGVTRCNHDDGEQLDESFLSNSSVETESTCSMEECMVKVEEVLKRNLKLNSRNGGESREQTDIEDELDITKLPGYQQIPDGCPSWKRAMIEKKNMQLYEDAKREIAMRRAEEEKWRDVPEWKRHLIIEKERKKREENAPIEVQRRRQEEEVSRIQNMPDWKKQILLKKKVDS